MELNAIPLHADTAININAQNLQTLPKIPSFPHETISKSVEYVDVNKPNDTPDPIQWDQKSYEYDGIQTPNEHYPQLQSISSITSATYTSSKSISGNISYSHSTDDDESALDIHASHSILSDDRLTAWNVSFGDQSRIHNASVIKLAHCSPSDDIEMIMDNANSDYKEAEERNDTQFAHQLSLDLPAAPAQFEDDEKESGFYSDYRAVLETMKGRTSTRVYETGKFEILEKVHENTAMLHIRDNIKRHIQYRTPPKWKENIQKLQSRFALNPRAATFQPQSFLSKHVQEQIIKVLRDKKLLSVLGKKKRAKSAVKMDPFMPNGPKTMFYIPRTFTEKILPQWIEREIIIDKTSVYEYIIKKLGVIDFRSNDYDTVQLLDLGLGGIYFVATRQNSVHSKYQKKHQYRPWRIDRVVPCDDVKEAEVVRPSKLLQDTEIYHMRRVMADREKLLDIINDTKWNKVPIHEQKSKAKGAGFKLTLDRKIFIEKCQGFIDNVTETNNDLNCRLIPIVMFGDRDSYWTEYVWIVRIVHKAIDIDIGISFRYNAESRHSVKVTGIFLDKYQILKQHHIISPADNAILDTFTTKIDSLYIGDIDDDKNRIKDKAKRIGDYRDAFREILVDMFKMSLRIKNKPVNSVHFL